MENQTKPIISCVIPVYNEAKRVSGVLKAVTGHPLLDEIIVVNDGSSDETEEVLRQIKDGIKLISYQTNRGKSHAVMLGIKAARNDLIMTVDSDLLNLEKSDISVLAEPILNGEADVSLSLRKNSLFVYKLFGLDFVSGERVFNKNIIADINQLDDLAGFALETFLNKIIVEKKLRFKVVRWKKVITPPKSQKFGFWKGIKEDFAMDRQIISLLTFRGMIKLFWQMYKLKVK